MSSARELAVISTIGPDRPGLVEAVSSWILGCGANIEESRMALLGGDFATIILVSCPAGLLEALKESQGVLEESHRLHIFVRPGGASSQATAAPRLRYELRGTALDQAGIIFMVTRQLSGRGINIVSAETFTELAPFSGAPVFHFQMEIDIPATAPINEVRGALADLANRENLDLELKAAVD